MQRIDSFTLTNLRSSASVLAECMGTNMSEINLSKTLIAKRKEKGITQNELAKHMGVSKASVSKWETGQSYPDISFLPQLATYFNISIDELINYEPQLLKEDINKLYHRLSKDFAEKPFHEVLDEVRENVKKYYSCFPLLFQMGVLLVNYHTLADEEGRQAILREAMELFERIKAESNDISLCRMANSMAATCYLILAEPNRIIDLLEDANTPMQDDSPLLAMGYSMMGDTESAKKILQIGIYQNLLGMIQNMTLLLQNYLTEPERAKEIIRRTLIAVDAFEVEQLHPGFLLSGYLTIAQAYTALNEPEQALEILQKYSHLAADGTFPLTLHGDSFFDKIDPWFLDFDLGVFPPRNEKEVKQSLLDGVEKNPSFEPLNQTVQYKHMIQTLSSIIGG